MYICIYIYIFSNTHLKLVNKYYSFSTCILGYNSLKPWIIQVFVSRESWAHRVYRSSHVYKSFSSKMSVNFNVFGVIMFYWIVCNIHTRFIVIIKSHRVIPLYLKSSEIIFKYNSSKTRSIRTGNYDSALDFFFFLFFYKRRSFTKWE